MKLFFYKLTHWEYWPFKIVYIPIYFLWLYYALKARTLFFFNACNPTMKNGGFINDSKKEIYDLIPQKYFPKTAFIPKNIALEKMEEIVFQENLYFPLIAKPDIGLRGSAVKKITTMDALLEYHSKANFDYLIQRFIPYPNEIGIFYVRFPNEKKGKITGIVGKEFLIIKGDGTSTIKDLLQKNPRYAMQLPALEKEYTTQLQEILPENVERNLVPYGNHCRGTKFMDYSSLITDELIDSIDTVCQQINGFYFGRLDIMYHSWEDLEKGQKFLIVEVNGSASEPTHIYDPKHSIFFAWKELARHITYMYQIGMQNRENGVAFLNYKEGMKEYKKHLQHYNLITSF